MIKIGQLIYIAQGLNPSAMHLIWHEESVFGQKRPSSCRALASESLSYERENTPAGDRFDT